jgi:hypothetical protein
MSIAAEKCLPLLDRDQPAIPPRSHCAHCDAPVDHRGEYHPTDESHDAREAILRLAQTVCDNPRLGLVVCMSIVGIRGNDAARVYGELIGKECSRQLLYDARVKAAKFMPDIEPLIFDRITTTSNKRNDDTLPKLTRTKPPAMQKLKQCRNCGTLFGAIKNKSYCQQCRPTCAEKVERRRGVYYPAEG